MKYSVLLFLFVLPVISYSQDQIFTKNEETLSVRILSEDKKSVFFYLFNEAGKKVQELDKKKIKRIKYEKPSSTVNSIRIVDDSLENKDLFSHVTAYLIYSGFEIATFDIEHLTVSALASQDIRISVEVDDHNANFSIYKIRKETSIAPSQSDGYTIRLAPSETKEPGEEKYPGEEQAGAGDSFFKDLDRVCRNYLMNNRGSLAYIKE